MKEHSEHFVDTHLKLLVNGDSLVMNMIILQYSKVLFNIAYGILYNTQETEDAIQETFIKLWEKREQLKADTSLDNYLKVLIRNHCISIVRKRKVRRRREQRFVSDQPFKFIENSIENDELRARLGVAFETLSITQRRIFDSVYLEGKSYLNVMEEHCIALQTVKNTISVALRRLRGKLKTLTN